MGVSGAPPLDVNAELVAARRELISVLEDLEARDWDKGTLCQGWRVRDVASHVALAPSVGVGRIIGGMVKARGNADRMIDAQARAAGEREPSEILRHLYRMAEDTRVPAGASAEKLLADTVIHSLDITHPNGWDLDLPADRVPAATSISTSIARRRPASGFASRTSRT